MSTSSLCGPCMCVYISILNVGVCMGTGDIMGNLRAIVRPSPKQGEVFHVVGSVLGHSPRIWLFFIYVFYVRSYYWWLKWKTRKHYNAALIATFFSSAHKRITYDLNERHKLNKEWVEEGTYTKRNVSKRYHGIFFFFISVSTPQTSICLYTYTCKWRSNFFKNWRFTFKNGIAHLCIGVDGFLWWSAHQPKCTCASNCECVPTCMLIDIFGPQPRYFWVILSPNPFFLHLCF